MSIKSDRWIRRQALEHRMIEPFEESQKGEGMVSYGVSSYGYDIRIADEFKIFTNVHTAMVDPKNFSDKSFVDFKGDVCIIPPNSFALGRTVEYFRIPRNVLTVCLGKSTYARCFSADTRVALLDGTTPTLEEMAHRSLNGEMFWGYAMGEHGRIIAALLHAPRFIGRDSLIEITLDNNETIQCTPDHKFIRRDGRMATANELRPGDSLMPLYRQLVRGYEAVYQPVNGNLDATHRLADEWNLVHSIYENQPGTHRHHIDHDRRNNMPWNLIRLSASEHIRHHNEENYGADFDAEDHGLAIRDALARRAEDPAWREHFATVQRDRASRFWHDDKYADARERLRSIHLASWTDERRERKREEMVQYFQDPAARAARGELSRRAWAADPGARRERQREIARNIKFRPEITSEVVRRALNDTGSIRGAARLLDCDRSVFRRFPEVIAEVTGRQPVRNHKIMAIRELPGDHDVYCLTVPEAGNFALAAGVFVRNCGIITNVTPFEPGWEGYATLEISNTTPLPAKIYANEGIAQVLFFESDEECEVSYADKKGKYQAQVGITLPRILQKDTSTT